MNEPAFRTTASLRRLATWALIAVAIALFLCIVKYASQRPPDFDGAMNLQVSYSLAHAEGHRRTYADRLPFPHEVQTHEPYQVPAAVVFKLFGMGYLQAQLTNLLYLAGLALVSLLLLRKRYGLLAGAAASLIVLVTPGILAEGLNGYGEVPGLFWAIAALLVFPWQGEGRAVWRVFAAGVFLGLAVSTKTVLMICFAWFGLCFVIAIASNAKQPMRLRLFRLAVLLFASLAPIALIELWRYVALGDWLAYKDWWLLELREVGRQAGTTSGYRDTAGGREKFLTHFGLLSGMYGLNRFVLAVWLELPLLVGGALSLRRNTRRGHGVLWCLLGAATIYFVWWLLITPTEKAWHRRILDGSLMLNLAWVYLVALAVSWSRDVRWRWFAAAASVLLIWMMVQFFITDANRKLWQPKDAGNFDHAVQVLSALPPDAQLYGIGWYSAPVLALFSERYLQDLNDVPLIMRDPRKPSYLVLDTSSIAKNVQRMFTSMYRAEALLPSDGGMQILRIHFDEINPEAIRRARSVSDSIVDVTNPNIVFDGFHRADAKGFRWMTSESLMGLRYDGSPFLSVSLYAPAFGSYMRSGGVSLHASLDGCGLGWVQVPKLGKNTVQFPVFAQCRPVEGETVVVRLSADNLVRNQIIQDQRALSVLVKRIGFSGSCDSQAACDRLLAAPVYRTAPPPKLGIEPKTLDLCGGRRAGRVTVSWNIPGMEARTWTIFVSTSGTSRKPWTAGQGSVGSRQTGEWVVDGMTFMLVDKGGRELARATARAKECRLSDTAP
jgi:hypothetical protein